MLAMTSKIGRSASRRRPNCGDGEWVRMVFGTSLAMGRQAPAMGHGRCELCSLVIEGKRYPTGRPAVERPGCLNRDWRSGFADSNP